MILRLLLRMKRHERVALSRTATIAASCSGRSRSMPNLRRAIRRHSPSRLMAWPPKANVTSASMKLQIMALTPGVKNVADSLRNALLRLLWRRDRRRSLLWSWGWRWRCRGLIMGRYRQQKPNYDQRSDNDRSDDEQPVSVHWYAPFFLAQPKIAGLI
jgi:hypothetical protein